MEKDILKSRAMDYHTVFTSESGRRVLEDLRASYGDRLSYVKGDPYETTRREGNREVFLHIQYQINLIRNPVPEKNDEEEVNE